MSEVHGPNHLFCGGCSFDDVALARAAWAGCCSSNGDKSNAIHFEASARHARGEVIAGMSMRGDGELRVYKIGGEPTGEDIDNLIEMLGLTRRGFARRAENRKAGAPAPTQEESVTA